MKIWRRRAASPWRAIRPLLAAACLTLILAACGAPTVTDPNSLIITPSPVSTENAIVTPTARASDAACGTGRLRVGDLPVVEESWRQGLDAATKAALEWKPDAKLTTFKVVCQLLEPGFRWQAMFYSANAQAYFTSDDSDVRPVGLDPSLVPVLRESEINFGQVYRALIKFGLTDDTVISASSGVLVKMNTEGMPFGPPSMPVDAVVYHLAYERLGQTQDVFVSGRDGAVYVYTLGDG